MSRQPRASGHFRTDYGQDLALFGTRLERASLAALVVALLAFPLIASPFQLDLACQVFLACVGSLSLMLLTGYAGQISLGHAGLIAAGAFTVGILFRETNAPFWITLPAAALVGAPARRHLRTAVAALARALSRGEHARAAFRGGLSRRRIRNRGAASRPASSSIRRSSAASRSPMAAPGISFCWRRRRRRCCICLNLLRARTGRAWRAIRAHETVAEALGIGIAGYKLLAFVISSAITAVAGALFAYYRGFVSVEAFSLFLTIQYLAMVIIGGMGSLLGALLGAAFVTLFPYVIEAAPARPARRATLCERCCSR